MLYGYATPSVVKLLGTTGASAEYTFYVSAQYVDPTAYRSTTVKAAGRNSQLLAGSRCTMMNRYTAGAP